MRPIASLLLLMAASQAAGQTSITSPRPDSVGVTVYRSPGSSDANEWNLDWLEGFALISERRTVAIPEGDSEIRFEGVAGGIIPESAIVSGLPDGVVEKNQDADLLSPGSLLGRYLGRRVQLQRTSKATGKVTQQEAIIRSGPDGAVVLQTKEGFEALRCTGINETLIYPEVPASLSDKPTLSVRTHSDRPASAVVTLSYLATGFDWRANYVATLRPDGRHVDLFAWVTLANGDPTSFRNASTNAVAGRLNTEDMRRRNPARATPLRLRCWPQSTTTSGLHTRNIGGFPDQSIAESLNRVAAPPPPMPERGGDDIVVTGVRMKAEQEELGDLKLYRIPEPVTVAARSQKQVAMIEQANVPVDLLYRSKMSGGDLYSTVLVVKAVNRRDLGLGLPLPAGGFALYEEWRGRALLVGEGSTGDKAVGEKVEVELSAPTNVNVELKTLERRKEIARLALTVANALPRPVVYEAELGSTEQRLSGFTGGKVVREDGKWIWRVSVPANSTRELRYETRQD
ncbi:MAG: hypothetical protein ABIQ32_05590 [Sphingomicrobium sp.]